MPEMNAIEGEASVTESPEVGVSIAGVTFEESKIWTAIGLSNAALLAEALSGASVSEMCISDPKGRTPLAAAIEECKYDCAKVLIGYDAALNVPAQQLSVWQAVQAAKKAAEDPEAEDPVDVYDAEWQKSLAEQLLGAGEH